ncbi:MAG TPA: protein kinase [Pirellulales bacterium]|nr:protein kinase [Pirellulales bacterium]
MNEPDISQTEFDPTSSPVAVPDGGAHDLLDDPRVAEVVGEYLERLEQGLAPDRGKYVVRYPELASAIEQCLAGLEMVRAVAPRTQPGGDRPGGDRPGGSEAARERAPRSLGDFEILRELGRGGMGVVYEALQLSLGRHVALKVLPFASTFDARQLQRFKNEAQAAALLHHTNIVPIYAVGCERGVHFYAMQLIEGQSLAVLIRQLRVQAGLVPAAEAHDGKSASGRAGSLGEGAEASYAKLLGATDPHLESSAKTTVPGLSGHGRPMSDVTVSVTAGTARRGETYFRKVARLMAQAADALDHAHQLGIVHRDVKPANLLVNTAGTLWVADFGLAQFQTDAGLTRTGDMLGTLRYMSPEQAGGQRTALDHRTDIYSLGATFYELLTLQPVFAGETRQELLFQILHNEPRAPRAVNRVIPVELETIVLKALRKAPAERYATAAEFADDIRRFLDDRPILARPPSPVDRLRKWSRRHPSVVVAGALLLVFGVVGLVASNWMIAAEQRKTAEALKREELRANETERLFRQAKEAVDVLIEVSEEELADKPMLEPTRKRLLQTALAFYEDFIELREGDTTSQAGLAAEQERVRRILYELNVLHREMQAGLLERPLVLAELRLAEEQKPRLAELRRQWDEERGKLFADFDRLDTETRHRRFVELAERHEEALATVLAREQLDRLRQIAIQSQGLGAFKDPDVVAALGLTAKQRRDIREIEREAFVKWHARRDQHHGPDADAQWEKRNKRDAVAKALQLFSDVQLSRWRELTGPTVDVLDDMRFPRRGGGHHGGAAPAGGPPGGKARR